MNVKYGAASPGSPRRAALAKFTANIGELRREGAVRALPSEGVGRTPAGPVRLSDYVAIARLFTHCQARSCQGGDFGGDDTD